MYKNTLVAESGLLYHGYDYSHTAVWANEDRGHSPEIWDRAVGWYVMALVDILEIMPSKYSSTFLAQIQPLAESLRDAADPDAGVWWLVMSQPGREGNYFESSGSVMFVYAMLKGIRLGYISDSDGSILAAAKKAYQYMLDNWVVEKADGTMDWLNTVSVGSLNSNGTFEVSIYFSSKLYLS